MISNKRTFCSFILILCGLVITAGCDLGDKTTKHYYGITYYYDADGDGFGDADETITAYSQPNDYVSDNTDCDDNDPGAYPGALEICGDGIDQNCDGYDLECDILDGDSDGDGDGDGDGDNVTYYLDADGDGYGDQSNEISASSQPAGYVADSTDCDDSAAAIYPGALEICSDGIDQDCDGSDLECGDTYYQDADGDGFGNPASSLEASAQPFGYVSDNTDCDDTDAAAYPGAAEVCGDGIDQNCDGVDTECANTYYLDADGDGFGDPNSSLAASTQPAGYVTDSTDCDDTDAAAYPGAAEICEDGVDQDCDGSDADCASGVIFFEEDWETGAIDPLKWTTWGTPSPTIEPQGFSSDHSFDPQGDDWCDSGAHTVEKFSLQGRMLSFDARVTITTAQYEDAGVGIASSSLSTGDCSEGSFDYMFYIRVRGDYNKFHVQYVSSGETFEENIDNNWHSYKIEMLDTGLINFYRDDNLIYTTVNPVNFAWYANQSIFIGGRSMYGPLYIDNIKLESK